MLKTLNGLVLMKKLSSLLSLLCALVVVAPAQSRNKMIKKFTQYGIAYAVQVQEGNRLRDKVFVMNFDGSNPRQILTDRESAGVGAVAKNKLFFVSNRDACEQCYFLYSCTYSGDSVRKVADLQLESPAISPRRGGQEIVAVGRIGEHIRHQLFLVDVRNGSFRQLTKDSGAIYGNPCFSPDGGRIVYSYAKNKMEESGADLYVMNDQGTGKRHLTRPSTKMLSAGQASNTNGVKWHPRENFISYVSSKDGRTCIFAVTPDGRRQWKLTDNEYAEGTHDWSSDGKWLVLTSFEPKSTQSHISLMHWKNKDQRQLTEAKFKVQQAPFLFEK